MVVLQFVYERVAGAEMLFKDGQGVIRLQFEDSALAQFAVALQTLESEGSVPARPPLGP